MRRESVVAWGLATAGWAVALWALLRAPPAGDSESGPPSAKEERAPRPTEAQAVVPADSHRLVLRPTEPATAPRASGAPAETAPPGVVNVPEAAFQADRQIFQDLVRPGPRGVDAQTAFELPDDAASLAQIVGDARESIERRAAALASVSTIDAADAARITEEMLSRDETSREIGNRMLDAATDRAFLPLLARRAREGGADARRHLDALARVEDRAWSALQATGEPDTPVSGDLPTAWASRQADMGRVWLVLAYDEPMRPDVVSVRESHQPGAVAEIAARGPDGAWETLWSGEATPGDAPRDFAPPLAPVSWRTKEIRLVLDTDRVPGWNEIDAVALEEDGRRQWATSARASSSYANSW